MVLLAKVSISILSAVVLLQAALKLTKVGEPKGEAVVG